MELQHHLEYGTLASFSGLERKRKKLDSKGKYRDGAGEAELGAYGPRNQEG